MYFCNNLPKITPVNLNKVCWVYPRQQDYETNVSKLSNYKEIFLEIVVEKLPLIIVQILDDSPLFCSIAYKICLI